MARNIFDVLSEQHREVEQALAKLAGAPQRDAAARREMADTLVIDLISHQDAESETLFRRLMECEDLRARVAQHRAEHAQASAQLQALLDLDLDDQAWLARLTEIGAAVKRHIQDEEAELFPQARRRLDEGEAEFLAQAFGQLQARRWQALEAA